MIIVPPLAGYRTRLTDPVRFCPGLELPL